MADFDYDFAGTWQVGPKNLFLTVSSASIERTFSQYSNILYDERRALCKNTLEQLLFFAAYLIMEEKLFIQYSGVVSYVLFFAAYLNMQQKLFIQYSWDVSFFISVFLQTIYSKINFNSGVRTNISQAIDPGSKPCRAINFFDFTDIGQKFQLLTMAQWVGKQGSEALGTSSKPSLYLHF